LQVSGAVEVIDCPVCRSYDDLVALGKSHAIRALMKAELDAALLGTAS
jgi:hypothetical protein